MSFYDGTKFNEIDLNTLPYVQVDRVSTESMPEPVISMSKLARYDGGVLNNKEYGFRTVTIEGRINAPDRAGFYSARDTLLKTLQGTEKRVEIPVGTSPREVTATMQNCIFSDTAGGYGTFAIQLVCADPFLYDVNRRTIINGTNTTAASGTVSFSETIGGSIETPPYIRIVVANITGGTSKYIDVSNQAGSNIRITRTWSTNDVLLIDMKARTCLVNSAAVDYTGTFWNLAVGDTGLVVADSFTTRTLNHIVTYKRRYI